jgi:hypothetical protein
MASAMPSTPAVEVRQLSGKMEQAFGSSWRPSPSLPVSTEDEPYSKTSAGF